MKGGILGLVDTIKPESGSTLMADMGDAPGSRGTPQARADKVTTTDFPEMPAYLYEASPEELASTDREQRALEDREIDFLNKVSGESDRMAALNYGINPENARMYPPKLGIAAALENFGEGFGIEDFKISDEQRRAAFPRYTQYDEDDPFARRFGAALRDALGLPGRGVGAAVGAVGDVIEPVATDFYAGFTEDGPSSAEVATEVIETSPTVEEPITPSGGVSRADIDAGTRLASQAEDEAQTKIARTRNFFEVAEDLKTNSCGIFVV